MHKYIFFSTKHTKLIKIIVSKQSEGQFIFIKFNIGLDICGTFKI